MINDNVIICSIVSYLILNLILILGYLVEIFNGIILIILIIITSILLILYLTYKDKK